MRMRARTNMNARVQVNVHMHMIMIGALVDQYPVIQPRRASRLPQSPCCAVRLPPAALRFGRSEPRLRKWHEHVANHSFGGE